MATAVVGWKHIKVSSSLQDYMACIAIGLIVVKWHSQECERSLFHPTSSLLGLIILFLVISVNLFAPLPTMELYLLPPLYFHQIDL